MYGLVLEGGGAKGSYQIGAYRALEELGIEIGGVAGTSIGSINGAMIVQGDWEEAYDLWYNIKASQLFDVDEELLQELKELNFNHKNIRYIFRRFKKILNNRGLDLKKARSFLDKNIDEQKIRNSKNDFGIVTVNLSEREAMELFVEDIPQEKLLDYLIASSYLPAFKMEKMDGNLFLDGGFYNNLPISLMVEKGFTDIIAIRVFGMGRVRKIDDSNLDITYIAPNEDLGGVLDFDQEQIRYNMKLGYYDALKVFKKLKGNKYYLKIKGQQSAKKLGLDYFLSLDEEQLEEIRRILNIEEYRGYRMLFEKAIPKLAKLLGVDTEDGYGEIVLSLLEVAAEKLDIERFKVYYLDHFVEEIKSSWKKKSLLETDKIPNFIRKNDLLSRAVSQEILSDIIDVFLRNE